MSTDAAVVDQSRDALVLIVDLLLGVEHVVTLFAEPHTLELVLWGLGAHHGVLTRQSLVQHLIKLI